MKVHEFSGNIQLRMFEFSRAPPVTVSGLAVVLERVVREGMNGVTA